MLDALEIKAHRLARAWGISFTTITVRPVGPCPRRNCGGSILAMGDDGPRRCLLCARADDDTTEETLAAEAALQELMG